MFMHYYLPTNDLKVYINVFRVFIFFPNQYGGRGNYRKRKQRVGNPYKILETTRKRCNKNPELSGIGQINDPAHKENRSDHTVLLAKAMFLKMNDQQSNNNGKRKITPH